MSNLYKILETEQFDMLHEKSEDILRGLRKFASFVVQAIAFKQTGKCIKYQKDLLGVVSADEQKIIETFLKLKNSEMVELGEMSVKRKLR